MPQWGMRRAWSQLRSSAQANDNNAGVLTASGATGGPLNLSNQNFFVGINDSRGGDPSGNTFKPEVFTCTKLGPTLDRSIANPSRAVKNCSTPSRFRSLGVGGLNDALGEQVIMGACTTCHDTRDAGSHSFPFRWRLARRHTRPNPPWMSRVCRFIRSSALQLGRRFK